MDLSMFLAASRCFRRERFRRWYRYRRLAISPRFSETVLCSRGMSTMRRPLVHSQRHSSPTTTHVTMNSNTISQSGIGGLLLQLIASSKQ